MVKPIWEKVCRFVNKNIIQITLNKANWLLSNFDIKVLVVISVVTKHQIFMSRLNKWIPSFNFILDKLKNEKNNHMERTPCDRMKPFYEFWGTLIADSVFKHDQ